MYNMFKTVLLGRSAVSALALVATLNPTQSHAQEHTRNCALVDGVLPAACVNDNAGLVVSRPSPVSAGHSSAGDLGESGFSISIDAGVTQPRRTVAGDPAVADRLARTDRALTEMGLRVTVDGLGAEPILNISTADLRRSYKPGDTVSFRSSSNYPAWIARAEIVVVDPSQPTRPIAVVPTGPNATANWTMPADAPEEMVYVLRVYDAEGRRDETVPLSLVRSDSALAQSELSGPVTSAGEGEDRTATRRIPVRGAAITVSGTDMPANGQLSLMGEPVVPGVRRNFVIQRILPPGTHNVTISSGRESQTQTVTIPQRDFFATGIAEVTLGRDTVSGEDWRYGRVAGYVDGFFANGAHLTGSVDTRDSELSDIFRHLTRRHPDQILRGIEDRDVWVTTGDDSKTENLAPTSGRLFLRLERDNNHLMWGDFRPESDLNRVVRTDRTLYGASGRYETTEVMPNGEARATVTGYAAQIDRLTQRDVFRGTGGSSYFMSRRDIESGTETLIIEVRDLVSGRIVSSQRLVEGRDYRIDYVQGVVILNDPLSPTAAGAGLATDRPLGDYDVNLVAQYDYVPAAGAALSDTLGGRAEVWVTPQLRFGVSGSQETTGLADNTLVGADILLQHNAGTYLSLDIARSEGPGLNTRTSLTGGLDLNPDRVAAGMRGQRALGVRAEGRLNLADVGAEGYVTGWYEDREEGFWSPDHSATESQLSYGLEGEARLSERVMLTFGAENAERGADRQIRTGRVGVETQVTRAARLEVELAHRTERNLDIAAPDGQNGSRTDLAARLTLDARDDMSLWVFGQATVDNSGDIKRDNRIGVGADVLLTDALSLSGEASTGDLGFAGHADLTYRPNATSSYRFGVREDKTAANSLTGAARRGLTFGADRQINDAWSTSMETVIGGTRDQGSISHTYGVAYTPSNARSYSFGVLSGQSRESDGTNVTRNGISLGTTYSDGETIDYRLRAEYRRDDSDNPAKLNERNSWLLSGDLNYQVSEDWRLIASLDLVVSKNDGDAFRDGRYVEGQLGYAYRPVDNDRLNALLSYTFLDDQPGADQVNVDGNINGPRQQSHILNASMSYDLDERWTLGLKYGMRYREQTDRATGDSASSLAHMGIARVDYRIADKWDILGEVRAFDAPRARTTEFGALVGVYREINPNARIGVGYTFGGISDDMRSIERTKEGLFLNVIGKF